MPGKVTLTSQDQQSIGKFVFPYCLEKIQRIRKFLFLFLSDFKLVLSLNQNSEVDVEVIKQSKIVSQLMEDLGEDSSTQMEPLPIPNVNSAILKKVIEWCK